MYTQFAFYRGLLWLYTDWFTGLLIGITGTFASQWTLIPTWISNYIHHKVCDGITYQFSNFNSATAGVWEWISGFIQHLTGHKKTYPC